MVQTIAAWLVSRPQNAILWLAATYILFLPLAGIFSGAVIVLLVLHQGLRRAMMQALFAAAVLALIALLTGGAAPQTALVVLLNWLPAFALAALLGHWRSLTLTLQASVMVALAGGYLLSKGKASAAPVAEAEDSQPGIPPEIFVSLDGSCGTMERDLVATSKTRPR